MFEDLIITRGSSCARIKSAFRRSLCDDPFILFPRTLAPGLYEQIISLCQQADFSPILAQEAIQMQTIVSLVAAEMGLAIVRGLCNISSGLE